MLYSDTILGYPPVPEDMVYRTKIKLPSNSFENEMSLNECESEAECEEKQATENSESNEDSETSDYSKDQKSNYPPEYGFQISTASDLNFCFHKYGKNCKIFLAVKFDSIEEATHSKVTVESLNIGCRLINNEPEVSDGDRKWDGDACQAMKSSTPESIDCQCEPKGSFRLRKRQIDADWLANENCSLKLSFSFSTDVAVSPRSIDFDELKSIRINESMIIILSYAVALTAFYLFGIFFAQVSFPPIRIQKIFPPITVKQLILSDTIDLIKVTWLFMIFERTTQK